MQAAAHRTCGFSLVELSIVLVILGLLTGGILAGRSLIHAAELRKVGTEINNYIVTVHGFRDRYFGLPGDITNASTFWTDAVNGNGDNRISWNTEGPNYWHQLGKAGLIATTISPNSSTLTKLTIGTDVPACALQKCGYTVAYITSSPLQPQLIGQNVLFAGGEAAVSGYTSTPIMPVADTWNIDMKFDDGKPDAGRVLAIGGTTETYPTSTYILDGTAMSLLLVDYRR